MTLSFKAFKSYPPSKIDTTFPSQSSFARVNILFVIVLLGAILAERENVVFYFAQAGLITLLLNVVMMIVAFYLAQLLGTGIAQKKCIAIECGLQNGTLAIFVATSLFDGGIYVIPAATYSLIMFATSLIFVFFVRKASS